jgi:hypothetical protein
MNPMDDIAELIAEALVPTLAAELGNPHGLLVQSILTAIRDEVSKGLNTVRELPSYYEHMSEGGKQ